MMRLLIYSFTNLFYKLSLVKPEFSIFKRVLFVLLSFASFITQRIESYLFLRFGYFRYKIIIHGKEILREGIEKGCILLPPHTGPYPLFGKVFHDLFPDKKLVIPFYHHFKLSIFSIFQKGFKRYGIDIVELGGSMKYIDPILKQGGSVVLFLDADFPPIRKSQVGMFNKQIRISNGPLWISKKYNIPIIPLHTLQEGNEFHLYVGEQININDRDEVVMQNIADALANSIEQTLSQWHSYDKFLLD